MGHQISPEVWDLMKQCFQLAPGFPGQFATENVEISDVWQNLDRLPTKKPATTTTRSAGSP